MSEFDELLSKALTTYIPEPDETLGVRVVERVRQRRALRWMVIPTAAIAAGLCVFVFVGRTPEAPKPVSVGIRPVALLVQEPSQNALHFAVSTHRKTRRPYHPAMTEEEKLFVLVATRLPEEFPRLVAIPESKLIQPLKIAELKPLPPLLADDKLLGESR